ncbi:PLP-dependent transferase [Microbacterium lacticum]|uniref:PLP-dependent transferase n=1 Tax=Microbacterium lacticum TaxID=33885 RepID=UPI0037C88C9B
MRGVVVAELGQRPDEQVGLGELRSTVEQSAGLHDDLAGTGTGTGVAGGQVGGGARLRRRHEQPHASLGVVRAERPRDVAAARTRDADVGDVAQQRRRGERANALAVAQWLDGRPEVASVDYVGLAAHPDHALAATLLPGGFGSVFSFTLRSSEGGEGGDDTARRFVEALEVFTHMTHLGDVRSLVLHPASTSHARRARAGAAPPRHPAPGVHRRGAAHRPRRVLICGPRASARVRTVAPPAASAHENGRGHAPGRSASVLSRGRWPSARRRRCPSTTSGGLSTPR